MSSKLKPTFARVLLKRKRLEKVGSIIIPEAAQKRHATTRCEIIAKGPSCEEHWKIGSHVLIGQYAGAWVNDEGFVGGHSKDESSEYFICQEDDILAVVE